MILLYLMGKMLGFMVRIVIWMVTLPFHIFTAPIKGFKRGVRRKPRNDDFWYFY